MNRIITYLCSIIFVVGFSYGQTTKIAEWTFENPGGYNTSIPEFDNLNLNYFTRTDGSNILLGIPSFNNIQDTYFFAAANVDDEPDNGNNPVFIYLDEVDISGYTNLQFRVHLAEDDNGAAEDWDNVNFWIFNYNDYVHFNYDIDNTGSFNDLLWIEAAGGSGDSNLEPRIDTNFDGLGNGAEITNTFTQYTQTIAGTGTSLDIEIEIRLNLSQEDIAFDNIEIWGDPIAPVEIDWCNIQWPTASPQNIDLGDTFDVYAQVYEPGITDLAGEGTTIDAWIGYNTINNDPEANDATWTWIPATYNADSGNNDEYTAEIGSALPVGTYFYASRFTLNGGTTYVYGGTGGIWNNDSVELIVNPVEVDWCNLQFPPSSTISFGDSFNVFGRVYEPGVTDTPSSQGAGISAWIGFSIVDATSSADFSSTDWTWIPANYNTLCPDCNDPTNTVENNDEYFVDIGPFIPGTGIYYYVTRFQLNGGPYSYGGYSPPIAPNPSGGGIWDGSTNMSQILTVNNLCASTVVWNGSWSAAPDLTTEVILDANYDMTTLPSFSACSLTVNAGVTLNVDDNKYVEVNNDIVNNGDIIVRSNGSVIQHNAFASVTGSASVEKTTAPLNNWYEYTYWSSPVVGETIENALSDSNPNRRYWFNAINFVDAQMEINNDNVLVPGQDDIDDNGNDWQSASGIMNPGVGYAATHSEIAFIGAGNQYKYTFTGPFNNGEVLVPVVRNDAETNDINWNFIGNPYPSAIDVDEFFTENVYNATTNPNGTLGGAIYLWSQNSPPLDSNNGNEGQNFSNSDYAMINGSGENPGGDMVTPNRYIPSGQGFFVDFSDSCPTSSGNVVFNNFMRETGNNDQFFRENISSQTNRISVKLTSDNGVFNQILVAYPEGATNGNDGMYYDAPRNLSSNNAVILYSIIEGETRKFAIQGKHPSSLSTEELVLLGFQNAIDIDTEFTLSIADLQGEFMNGNTVYLKDNLLNIYHDLSTSDYNFTSEVGEFNERFEIRFAGPLSVNSYNLQSNNLIVSKNNDDSRVLDFSTTNQSIITNIKVFDILGRMINDVDFNENQIKVSLQTSAIKSSILIVKATIVDGLELTKKIIHQ